MIPLIGYVPDADPTTPGIMTDVVNIIPNERGFVGAPAGVPPASVGALASACKGAAIITKLDGTRRVLAGTQTKLYELIGTAWTDESRGGLYSGGTDNRWSFCQFGDTTLASNYTEPIQSSVGYGFTDLTAPKAKVIVTSNGFVVAFNTNDGTYGVSPDRWWCSALNDCTDWTVAVSTQSNTGRLVSAPGEIVAALPLGAQIVAYKQTGLYLGSYVGSPVVWQWDQIPGESGCVGPNAVCDIDGAHLYVGLDNIWIYDGTRPRSIATGSIRKWFFANSSQNFRYLTICTFDRQTNRVWIFYPSVSASICDSALVYHLTSKRWGKVTVNAEASLNYISSGYTIDGLSILSATIDGLDAIAFGADYWGDGYAAAGYVGTVGGYSGLSFDSQIWLAGGRAFSVFDSTHQLMTLTGPSASSSFTSGDVGDDNGWTTLRRARVRFVQAPDSASGQSYSKANEGDSLQARSSFTMVGSRADLGQSDRFHRVRFDFTGDVEFNGIDFDLVPDGEE